MSVGIFQRNDGLQAPNENQTIVHICAGPAAGPAGTAIYTIPTGKTFYVTGATLITAAQGAAAYITDGTNIFFKSLGPTVLTQFIHLWTGGIIAAFPSATVLKAVDDDGGGGTSYWDIWGWIE